MTATRRAVVCDPIGNNLCHESAAEGSGDAFAQHDRADAAREQLEGEARPAWRTVPMGLGLTVAKTAVGAISARWRNRAERRPPPASSG